MKRFNLFCLIAVVALYAICLGMIAMAPATIAVHFGSVGQADSLGSRWYLLLEPTLFSVIAQIMTMVLKYRRKRQGLQAIPNTLPGEYAMIGILVVLFVLFTGLMWQQIAVG